VTEGPGRLILVGFMGAGKTTVGPLLAARLSWGFTEMDRVIEEATGLSVAEIFEKRGEPFFREEERRAALALVGLKRIVVATGGGAFAEPGTRAALQEGSVTVWLHAPFETLFGRVGRDPSRPLAVDRATMETLWAERDPSYRQADLAFETSGQTPDEVARKIAERVFGTPGTLAAKDR
jgi:shikimate kinase